MVIEQLVITRPVRINNAYGKCCLAYTMFRCFLNVSSQDMNFWWWNTKAHPDDTNGNFYPFSVQNTDNRLLISFTYQVGDTTDGPACQRGIMLIITYKCFMYGRWLSVPDAGENTGAITRDCRGHMWTELKHQVLLLFKIYFLGPLWYARTTSAQSARSYHHFLIIIKWTQKIKPDPDLLATPKCKFAWVGFFIEWSPTSTRMK